MSKGNKLVKGLRINDKVNGNVVVSIGDVLNQIPDGDQYVWSNLFLD